MKKKIIILGRSQKFIKIIKNLYVHDDIKILSWRKLDKLNKYGSYKNPNIISASLEKKDVIHKPTKLKIIEKL